MRRTRTSLVPAAALALLMFLPACSIDSDETAIRKLVSAIGPRVEKRDLPGLMAMLAEGYQDFEGRDRAATEALVGEYLRRRFGIVVHLLHSRVEEVRPEGSADVTCEVALSSGAAEALRRFVRFAGDLFRFKLVVRRTAAGWKVVWAEWESVGAGDLFPESLEALGKLFPGPQ